MVTPDQTFVETDLHIFDESSSSSSEDGTEEEPSETTSSSDTSLGKRCFFLRETQAVAIREGVHIFAYADFEKWQAQQSCGSLRSWR